MANSPDEQQPQKDQPVEGPAAPSVVGAGEGSNNETSTITQQPPPATPFTLRQPPPGRPVSFLANKPTGDVSTNSLNKPQGEQAMKTVAAAPASAAIAAADVDMPGPSGTSSSNTTKEAQQRNESAQVVVKADRDKERGLFMLVGDSAPSLAQVRKAGVEKREGRVSNW